MHGIIFSEFKKFADERFGERTWSRLLDRSGLSLRVYLPTQEYPDEEVARLVAAAAAAAKVPAAAVLEDFGAFMVPDLVRLYGALLEPAWRTLEVIEHTEEVIHRVVRLRNPGARPPELLVQRCGADEVRITYQSARRMCGVAKGIVRGLATHFGEVVQVDEAGCMLTGAAACEIIARRQPPTA